MPIDRAGLAEFLRAHRQALQPEDVGIPRGMRRRTAGLRREEVAALSHMSVDYYTRLERSRGPHPSEQMLAAIAQGLHLSLGERDHLFRLAGQRPPERGGFGEHVSPGMLRIVDRLGDTPTEVVTELGETLIQTDPSIALSGEMTRYSGPERSIYYRWFTDPGTRRRYDFAEHAFLTRLWASRLREVAALRGPQSRAAHYVDLLMERSEEFRGVWEVGEVGLRPREVKHFVHPELGALEVNCQTLLDPQRAHALLVYTATPGSESHEKLRLLSVIGKQVLDGQAP